MELLRSIPGPYFLLIYAFFSFIVILITRFLVKKDGTGRLPIPEPTSFTALEIAILRDGTKGAIITSTFELWRKKAIKLKLSGKNKLSLDQVKTNTISFNKLELSIYRFLKKPRLYQQLFNKTSVKTINNILQKHFDKLEDSHLIISQKIKNKQNNIRNLAGVLLLVLGVTKLMLGIEHDKPYGFLIIFIIASLVLLYVLTKAPKNRQTKLGKRFMAKANQRFKWLKTSEESSILADDNLLYGVAIFGIVPFMNSNSSLSQVLANPSILERIAPKSYIRQGGCGYGCSDGCSGGSGCSSGCSGGCGGCGGD